MVKATRLLTGSAARGAGRGERSLAGSLAAWTVGLFAAIAVVVLGSILAVVFAATLAVALVLMTGVAGMVLLAPRPVRVRVRASAPGRVIEARKVGHSWVAYGWDQDA
jgi:hypothetical protein